MNLPAFIFASISTLESAGIQDSGSSTRSWIGMLQEGKCGWDIILKDNLPLTYDSVVLHTRVKLECWIYSIET